MTLHQEVSQMAVTRRRAVDGPAAAPRTPIGRVLVAEDERDVAELIRYTLSKEG